MVYFANEESIKTIIECLERLGTIFQDLFGVVGGFERDGFELLFQSVGEHSLSRARKVASASSPIDSSDSESDER